MAPSLPPVFVFGTKTGGRVRHTDMRLARGTPVTLGGGNVPLYQSAPRITFPGKSWRAGADNATF